MTTLKTAIIETTVKLTAMQCPICGVHYGLDEGFRKRALEDSGRGWFCTNGHSLIFTESEADKAQKRASELEERLKSAQGWSQYLEDSLAATQRSLSATKAVVTRQRNRVSNGVCLFCHRHFANVERHMASKHSDEPMEAE